ncbi:hypothetical protein L345_02432, partial [Ophiophagus hannah]
MTITCSSSIPSFHTDAPESARYSRNPDLAQKVMAHKVIERVVHQMGSRVGHTATFGHKGREGEREREREAGAALTQRAAKYSLLLNWSCQRGGGDEITGFYIWKSSERQPSKAHRAPRPTVRYFAQDMAYQMKGGGESRQDHHTKPWSQPSVWFLAGLIWVFKRYSKDGSPQTARVPESQLSSQWPPFPLPCPSFYANGSPAAAVFAHLHPLRWQRLPSYPKQPTKRMINLWQPKHIATRKSTEGKTCKDEQIPERPGLPVHKVLGFSNLAPRKICNKIGALQPSITSRVARRAIFAGMQAPGKLTSYACASQLIFGPFLASQRLEGSLCSLWRPKNRPVLSLPIFPEKTEVTKRAHFSACKGCRDFPKASGRQKKASNGWKISWEAQCR